MTKVSIDTDKISNSLLPTAQNEKNKSRILSSTLFHLISFMTF